MGNPIVEIADGNVQGVISENFDGEKFYSFLGIPYGKPPIGNLRFKAPEPVEKWEGIKIANDERPKCIQIEPFETDNIEGSEDCLYLNVYTKKLPGEIPDLKPVIVYIHGGKFYFGSNKKSMYGPEFLLLQNIVLVIPKWRLGVFGFLKLDDVSLDIPGNAGMKDQVLSLQWVQRNIHKFGGDPNNVTLCGHSSGAVAVHYHILSPSSRGLFHKIVMLSGSVLIDKMMTEDFNLTAFTDLLEIKVETSKDLLEQLRKLPPETLVEAQNKYLDMHNNDGHIFKPIVEAPNSSAFLTEDPLELISNGKFNKVPILMSYTDDEALFYDFVNRLAKNPEEKVKYVPFNPKNVISTELKVKMEECDLKEICEEMEKNYHTDNSYINKKALLLGDIYLTVPLIAAARTHSKLSDEPVYLMRWSVNEELNYIKAAVNGLHLEGTSHADEIGYIFAMDKLPRPTKGSSSDRIVRSYSKILKNFCAHGNPSIDFYPDWQPLQIDDRVVLNFGNEVRIIRIPEEYRLKMWQRFFESAYRETYLGNFKVS